VNRISELNVSTKLTLIRLFGSLTILPVLLLYILPFNQLIFDVSVAAFFMFLALTDFFDGYYARKYEQITEFGRILDPIADKFLNIATLICLLSISKIGVWWVLILLAREIFIMSLRNIALQEGVVVPVLYLGKCKTLMQIVTLFVIILNPETFEYIYKPLATETIHISLLSVTTMLSLISAGEYVWYYIRQMQKKIQ
jgi:CDP-diacylglycerol--glycerol-3-phosphate 3-phosphatidyltransferase